ncbi:MAG TPA: hypothetical protein VF607_02455 [Verrucomicrobiae bacterium]
MYLRKSYRFAGWMALFSAACFALAAALVNASPYPQIESIYVTLSIGQVVMGVFLLYRGRR